MARLQRIATSPLTIVLVAFSLRVAAILADGTYQAPVRMRGWFFAAEMGKIAGLIASGHGFTSPFSGYMGPSAWIGPVYPLLLAGVFKVFGLYTSASAFAILTLNCVFGALTSLTIYLISSAVFGGTVAIAAAWTWAVLPYAIFWPSHVIWETSLSAFLLSALVLLTIRMQGSERMRSWLALGTLAGIAALTNAATLSFLPVSAAWLCWRLRRPPALAFSRVALLALAFAATVSPWVVRNYLVFGQFVFPRSDFGEELLAGNHPGSNGLYWVKKPWDDSEMQRLGEIRYMAERRRRALQFIRDHPGQFALFTLKRIAYFWCDIPQIGLIAPHFGIGARHGLYFAFAFTAFWGLAVAIRRGREEAFLFLGLFLLYPLIYYITHCNPRYQHPITPEMLILSVYLFYAHVDQPSLLGRLRQRFKHPQGPGHDLGRLAAPAAPR